MPSSERIAEEEISVTGKKTRLLALKSLCKALVTKHWSPENQNHELDNPNKVLKLANRHRIAGLLSTCNLNDFKDLRQTLEAHSAASAKSYFSKIADIVSINKLLESADVPFIMLKGIAIAERFYENPHLRYSNDIDILVPAPQTQNSLDAMLHAGHKQTRPDFTVTPNLIGMLMHKTSGIDVKLSNSSNTVELHWRCVQIKEMLTWDFSSVSPHTENITIGGNKIRVLKPEYQLVYLVCHGSKHGWFRLKWLYDIHLMISNMEAETQKRARDIALENGQERMLSLALALSKMFFGTRHQIEDDWVVQHLSRRALRTCLNRISGDNLVPNGFLGKIQNVCNHLAFRWSLRTSYRYRISLIGQYLYNFEDIKTLGLSKDWLPLYWIAGPMLFVLRSLRRRKR